MKKAIIALIILALIYCGYFFARGFLGAMLNGNSPRQIERRLQAMATELNQETPKKMDDITTMEKVTAGPGLRVDYFYKLDLTTNRLDLPAFAAKLKEGTLKHYKSSAGATKLREWQVEIHHEYRDKDGNVAAAFVILPKDF